MIGKSEGKAQGKDAEIYYPLQRVIDEAHLKEYDSLYRESIENRPGFWEREAEQLSWFKRWETVLDDSKKPFYKWFVGGKINIIDMRIVHGLSVAMGWFIMITFMLV